jgi:tRNA(Arg) A34 adenosine deaminase TadA
MPMTDERMMRLAIAAARNAPKAPFGAVIAIPDGAVIATGFNRGEETPTLHGEIDVINKAFAVVPGADWASTTLYTTAEPCPMCAAAIVWAGIGRVVYGTSIPTLVRLGWWQLDLRAADVFARAPGKTIELVGGVLESECDALFSAGRA